MGFTIFTGLCSHYHNLILKHGITLKRNPVTIISPSPTPGPPYSAALGNHGFTFCLYRFAHSGHLTYMGSPNMWSSVTSFFPLA